MTQFSSLSLSSPILKALQEEGYTTPTPIQIAAIPPALSGRDVLGCADTGTGKTAAFAIPILEQLAAARRGAERATPHQPSALVLAPTRELAAQIAESFVNYGRHTGFKTTAIFGGVKQFQQVNALRRGVDILIATPGRLMDLLQQREVSLSRVRFFVLDEADRMLDMGFIQPIRRIESLVAQDRQTMLFSATMPREIQQLANSFLKNPVKVSVEPATGSKKLIEQWVYYAPRSDKQYLLEFVIRNENPQRALVFTKTKRGADVVCKRLRQAGIEADSIHGDKAQNRRIRALDSFRSGEVPILVATDVAARGIDVEGITHVINFEIPNVPEAYVHRIGRTGRAGAHGIAIALCDPSERGFLRDIERTMGEKIQVIPPVDQKARQAVASQDVVPLNPKSPTTPGADRTSPRRVHPPREQTHRRDDSRAHTGASHKSTVHKSEVHKSEVHKSTVHKSTSHSAASHSTHPPREHAPKHSTQFQKQATHPPKHSAHSQGQGAHSGHGARHGQSAQYGQSSHPNHSAHQSQGAQAKKHGPHKHTSPSSHPRHKRSPYSGH